MQLELNDMETEKIAKRAMNLLENRLSPEAEEILTRELERRIYDLEYSLGEEFSLEQVEDILEMIYYSDTATIYRSSNIRVELIEGLEDSIEEFLPEAPLRDGIYAFIENLSCMAVNFAAESLLLKLVQENIPRKGCFTRNQILLMLLEE